MKFQFGPENEFEPFAEAKTKLKTEEYKNKTKKNYL
jgi:hypothetical protein